MTRPDPIPTAASNPFATCWTRPGALPFLPTDQASVDHCLAVLRGNGMRGKIVGPHGAGKSTLLRALQASLEEAGVPTAWLRGGRDAAPATAAQFRGRVCLIDSFEELGRWRRRQWRRHPWGVVVTTHGRDRLPALAELRPTLADIERCFGLLTQDRSTPVTRTDLRNAFARHEGNVREVWFDLYDRHEQRQRNLNPSAAGA
ncbi:hypothetical protein Pla123a_29680 [Posidoniimonas polymericola]|uniref:AAA+ ATPase domain-containing protein n=1 Tax=Posidoniimonas polymericola TaxID=2528002 RepID=A0A5C5YKW4_9BACT|nr:hypothetical protein [Posidoniimonas polymericola]TWT75459.1 hypothetical protein Pla123a_29680 [Posidoniimonas polymericola]